MGLVDAQELNNSITAPAQYKSIFFITYDLFASVERRVKMADSTGLLISVVRQ